MANYRILHHLVGPFERGRVVSKEQFDALGEGVSMKRLLALEAVEETDDEVTDDNLPVSPETRPSVTSTDLVVDAPGHDRPTAQSLLKKKERAELREEAVEEVGEETEEVSEEEVRYEDMSVTALRAAAKDREIEVPRTANKAELVAILKEADETAGGEGGEEQASEE